MAGRFYVNIHSDVHPQGEIRGQITPFAALPVFPGPGAYVSMAALAGFGLAALRRGSGRF